MNPEFALRSGIMASKTKILSGTDWVAFLEMLIQVISIGGVIIFGFLTSWTFGREYSDGTVKDLLALPVRRSSIVAAKFITIAIWCLFLAFTAFSITSTIGLIIGVKGFSLSVFYANLGKYFICTIMVILLSPPIAFFACYGKGYLPPLGFLIIAIFFGNIIGTMGHGAYFPWVIPGLYSGAAGEVHLPYASYIVLLVTSLVGSLATFIWWQYADQK
jgi:ABC-2 type transport system permease protein